MFKSEIDAELFAKQQEQLSKYKDGIDKNTSPEIKRINDDIKRIEDNLNFLVQNEGIARKDLRDCLMRLGPGCPQNTMLYNQAKEAREKYETENKPKLLLLEQKKLEVLGGKEKIDLVASKKAATLDGLLERIAILHDIAPGISLFVTLLFLAVELTPIFFKLMLVKSPYDFLKDNVEELMKAEQGIHIEYNYHKDKEGQERDLVTYLNKEKIIVETKELQEVQKRLVQYAISKYEVDMKRKIDENPDQYIKHDLK
jgi:hypothetical protein